MAGGNWWEDESAYVKPFWQDEGAYAVHKPDEPSLFEEFAAKTRAGLGAGKDWLTEAVGHMVPDLASERSRRVEDSVATGLGYQGREDQQRADYAQRIAQQTRDFQMQDRTSDSTEQGLQEIGEADGLWDATKAAARNPRAVAMTTAQSLGMVAPGMLAGMSAGPVAPAVIGANSAAIEYESTLRDTLSEAGVDLTDASKVRRALDDSRLMARAKDRAAKRGVAIGTFDAFTAGVAGRLLAASRGTASAAARTVGETGMQLGGGMAGETTAQLATEGRITGYGDIVMEGIAEVPTSITEVPTNYRRAREAFKDRQATEAEVQGDYRGFADEFSATITSTRRSRKRNAEVGGVPNSQHLTGTAADFVVPDSRKAAFKERARARGYEVIDEGDHIHLELPKGARPTPVLTPGAQRAVTAVEQARKARGLPERKPIERKPPTERKPVEAPLPPRSREQLLEQVRNTTLPPEQRREAKRELQQGRRLSDNINALRDQMLDSIIAQSLPEPAPIPALPPAQPIPPAPVSGANQPAETVSPTPPAATPPPAAPIAPQQAPVVPDVPTQAPVEAAPVAPPAQPMDTPQSQSPVNPVAQPAPVSAPGPWQAIGEARTDDSEKVRQAFNTDRGLNQIIQTHPLSGQLNPPRKLESHEVVEIQVAPAERQRLDEIGRILGRKVILYDLKTPGNEAISGFAFDDRHIFINPKAVRASQQSLLGLAGHEFTHTLRKQGNALMEDLVAFAKQRVNVDSSYVQRMFVVYEQAYAQRGMSQDKFRDVFTEELLADLIGDIISDEQFWAELAQENPSLFRRTLKRLIAFLRGLADRAKRLGQDDAFHEIEEVRRRAVEMLKQHAVAVVTQQTAKPKRTADIVVDGQSMLEQAQLAPDGSPEKIVALLMLEAKGDTAKAIAMLEGFADDYGPEAVAAVREQLEQIQFMEADQPGIVNRTRAKVADPDEEAAEAWSYRQHLREQAAVARSADALESKDYLKGVQEASRVTPTRAPAMPIITAEQRQFFKDANPAMATDESARVWFHGTARPNTALETKEQYGGAAFLASDSDFASNYAAQSMDMMDAFDDEGGGIQLIPLVTNASKPWDYQNAGHVKRLLAELKAEYRTPAKLVEGLRPAGKMTWSDIEEELKRGQWEVVELPPVTKLIREMGFDSFYVQEDSNRNLGVFDPRSVKSAYGNVGAFGTRPPTAEEAASLGMTLEEAVAAQQAGDIRLSIGTVLHTTFTQGLYTTGNREQMERWFVDEYRDLREIQKLIGQQVFGGRVPPGLDAHRNENLRHGAYQDARSRAEERFIKPIAKIISKVDGADLDGFSRYLWHRHAGERDAYLRNKLAPGVQVGPDGLAGISPQEAQAAIAALDPAVRRAYERAAKFIDGMRKFTLDTLVGSGQITREHHANVLAQYQHYVPLRGMPDGSEALNNGGGRGLTMNSKALGPRAAGRRSEPQNIIEEMMRDMDNALVGVQKQRVIDSVVGLIAAHPDPALWEVAPVAAERKWVNGVLTVVQTNGEAKDQITFMHRGIPVKIEIRHPQLRKAMLNLQEPLPQWLRRIGRVTRFLSAVKTSFSPFFLLVNPVRDAGLAIMGVGAEHGMGALRSMAQFYPHTYGVLMRDDNHLKVAPSSDPLIRKLQQYNREFSSVGGKTGYTYVQDIREQQKKLRHLIARHSKSPGMAELLGNGVISKDGALLARKFQQNVAHLFETVNDMAENSTRLSVYAAMRESGMSVEDAAAYAKEVTVNFNRRGSFGKALGGFYMFFNAAVQGGMRTAKLMRNKKFAAMMGSMFATSYTLALAQMFAAGDDDDGESKYDKAISDKQAQRTLSVYLGNGKSLALPVPYGPNIFTYMGYRFAKLTYDAARGRNPSYAKAAGDIMAQATMSMSPIDPGKGWTAFLPEAARIPAQAATNTNDFGGKISPKLNPFDHSDNPKYDQTDTRTGTGYRWIAQALNTASFGNDYRAGFVDLTGEQVRYMAEQLGGGPARFASESYELVDNLLAGIDPEPSDVPLANVYFRGKGHERHAGTYYDNLKDYENTVADWRLAIKRGDEKKLDEIIARAPWIEGAETDASTTEGRLAQQGSVMEAARDIEGEMKALRADKAAILSDPNLSRKDKKQQAYAIDQEVSRLQQEFNASLNAGRGFQPRQGWQTGQQ